MMPTATAMSLCFPIAAAESDSIPVVKRPTRIHRLIEDQGIVMLPGIYDGLSASVVQKTGFSAAFISGYSVSASMLGKPDIGLLT